MDTSASCNPTTFMRAHLCWRDGDFAGFLDCLDEDIVYLVNVNGEEVPYAMSAVGKEDVRFRLQLLLDTMTVNRFDVEKHTVLDDHEVSVVHGIYTHKTTGEVLDKKVRFKGWEKNGLLTRIEEIQDAKYVEAFQRFVQIMQEAITQKAEADRGDGT